MKAGNFRWLIIDGWVEDTRGDTKCAYVTIKPHKGGTIREKACGRGTRKNFHLDLLDERGAELRLSIA
ncbi:hypothetical protein OG749_01570 [Streptomyces nojiriensis]|uniref:hypothetical protein n=1 Tax=Streptomyces nojiriensis TaxID=66374 RepID=UPI002E19968C